MSHEDGQVAKIKRLQTAVNLMIEDIQAYEFEKNLNRPRPEPLPFIEDYGVTAEDMW